MAKLNILTDKRIKYVFFDIFDTIVYRNVQPEFTKKIWANHLTRTLDLNVNMLDLYKTRNRLEMELGAKNEHAGNDCEFTYKELIEELYHHYKFKKISFKDFYEASKNLEVTIEQNSQSVDEDIIKEIKNLKKEGKKIYCVSDMYLSKEMIKEIFKHHGILDYFDDIFVSCENLKNKKTGNLYNYVLDKLKAEPRECAMVGDNYSSDYETPKRLGIEAVHLKRQSKYEFYDKYLTEHETSNVYACLDELSKTSTDNFEHAIFSLYVFIEKLYFELIKNNHDEVFFLSREGEYLKKLFDAYVEKTNGKKIKSHYLLVSRKATYLPSLKNIEEENFDTLLKQYSYITVTEFLKSLNFSKDELTKIEDSFREESRELIKKLKLDKKDKKNLKAIITDNFDEKIPNFQKSNVFKQLKDNKVFKEIFEKNRVEQKELFKKYVKEMTPSKRICVVDVGWNGSIQDNIQNILGSDYEVSGYLYGLVSRDFKAKPKNKKGLIFYNVPKLSSNYSLYYENRTIFEILLGASHGSANRYTLKNNKVEVLLFEKDEEKKIYKNVVSKIQNNMFNTYQKLLDMLCDGFYDLDVVYKKINQIHFNMVFKPTKEQLVFFNKIYHYENFGVFEFTEFNLKKKLTWKYYIKENAKFVLRHKVFFYDTFWPVLKLNNEKLVIPKFIYVNHRKIKLKMKGII